MGRGLNSARLRRQKRRLRPRVQKPRQQLERLQQENHELRRGLAAQGAEWEARAVELEGDVEALRAQLGEQRSEQQDSGRERARALGELSEQNLRLSQQLAQASQTEQELQRELDTLRGQCQAQALAGAELRTRLESLQGELSRGLRGEGPLPSSQVFPQNQMLQSRRQDLEAQIRGLREEVEKGQGRLQTTHEELLLLRRERREHSLEVRKLVSQLREGTAEGAQRSKNGNNLGRWGAGPSAAPQRGPAVGCRCWVRPADRPRFRLRDRPQLERARSEAGEALSALRRLQRRVSELEEESRLQDADVSSASLQSELAHSLDEDGQGQGADARGDSPTTRSAKTREASGPQPSPPEESLEPPKKRASLSPAEILEEQEAEVAKLQDEIALQQAELQSLREERQRQKELRAHDDPGEALNKALSDRDEAVNKALELSLELKRVSLERDSLSRELLRAISQK
ncbi:BICD -like cargo adapter 2, partial [Saguinus oedipus]